VYLVRKVTPSVARIGLLVVSPHPDDESVTTGGLLARYAAQGIRTAVVTCTGGEEGEIVTPGADVAALRPHLGSVRNAELRAACQVLGVGVLRTLGYRDSGMRETDSTLHRDAFCNADLDEAVGRLVAIVRELRPEVMVTESLWGTYGHPDHVMARRVALRAFAAAGNDAAYPERGQPWQPGRLYAIHPTADRWGVSERWEAMAAQMHAEADGAPFLSRWSLDRVGDEPVTARIDVSAYVGLQRAAIGCHRSQFPVESWWLRMPLAARQIALGTARLSRLCPLPPASTIEHDLFPMPSLDARAS
jgi:LmbE family N-acetylglucosaminyl deacetylase